MAGIGTMLHDRIWKSYRSTILGLLVATAGELLNYFYLSAPDPRVHAVCALLTTIFVGWKDKAVKEGTIKMLVIAFCFLSFGAYAAGGTPTARTEEHAVSVAEVVPSDPPPSVPPTKAQIGGCVKNGKLCFGPTFALSMAAINLTTKKVEGSFSPGVGVGATFNPGTWSSFGLDLYLSLDPGAQKASGAAMAKILNGYVRAGISKGFIGDTSTRLLFATGIDL